MKHSRMLLVHSLSVLVLMSLPVAPAANGPSGKSASIGFPKTNKTTEDKDRTMDGHDLLPLPSPSPNTGLLNSLNISRDVAKSVAKVLRHGPKSLSQREWQELPLSALEFLLQDEKNLYANSLSAVISAVLNAEPAAFRLLEKIIQESEIQNRTLASYTNRPRHSLPTRNTMEQLFENLNASVLTGHLSEGVNDPSLLVLKSAFPEVPLSKLNSKVWFETWLYKRDSAQFEPLYGSALVRLFLSMEIRQQTSIRKLRAILNTVDPLAPYIPLHSLAELNSLIPLPGRDVAFYKRICGTYPQSGLCHLMIYNSLPRQGREPGIFAIEPSALMFLDPTYLAELQNGGYISKTVLEQITRDYTTLPLSFLMNIKPLVAAYWNGTTPPIPYLPALDSSEFNALSYQELMKHPSDLGKVYHLLNPAQKYKLARLLAQGGGEVPIFVPHRLPARDFLKYRQKIVKSSCRANVLDNQLLDTGVSNLRSVLLRMKLATEKSCLALSSAVTCREIFAFNSSSFWTFLSENPSLSSATRYCVSLKAKQLVTGDPHAKDLHLLLSIQPDEFFLLRESILAVDIDSLQLFVKLTRKSGLCRNYFAAVDASAHLQLPNEKAVQFAQLAAKCFQLNRDELRPMNASAIRNLAAYLPVKMLENFPVDVISSVFGKNPHAHPSLCRTAEEKQGLRRLILQKFKEPSSWAEPHLYHMGCLAEVLTDDDFSSINPAVKENIVDFWVACLNSANSLRKRVVGCQVSGEAKDYEDYPDVLQDERVTFARSLESAVKSILRQIAEKEASIKGNNITGETITGTELLRGSPSFYDSTTLSTMRYGELMNALDAVSSLQLSSAEAGAMWGVIQCHWNHPRQVPGLVLRQLGSVSLGIPPDHMKQLNLNDTDVISSMSAVKGYTSEQIKALATAVLRSYRRRYPADLFHVESLGQIICGFPEKYLRTALRPEVLALASPAFFKALKVCPVGKLNIIAQKVASKKSHGPVHSFSSDDVEVLGPVVAGLDPGLLYKMPLASFQSLVPEVAEGFSPEQVEAILPAASFMQCETLQTLRNIHPKAINRMPQHCSLQSPVRPAPELLDLYEPRQRLPADMPLSTGQTTFPAPQEVSHPNKMSDWSVTPSAKTDEGNERQVQDFKATEGLSSVQLENGSTTYVPLISQHTSIIPELGSTTDSKTTSVSSTNSLNFSTPVPAMSQKQPISGYSSQDSSSSPSDVTVASSPVTMALLAESSATTVGTTVSGKFSSLSSTPQLLGSTPVASSASASFPPSGSSPEMAEMTTTSTLPPISSTMGLLSTTLLSTAASETFSSSASSFQSTKDMMPTSDAGTLPSLSLETRTDYKSTAAVTEAQQVFLSNVTTTPPSSVTDAVGSAEVSDTVTYLDTTRPSSVMSDETPAESLPVSATSGPTANVSVFPDATKETESSATTGVMHLRGETDNMGTSTALPATSAVTISAISTRDYYPTFADSETTEAETEQIQVTMRDGPAGISPSQTTAIRTGLSSSSWRTPSTFLYTTDSQAEVTKSDEQTRVAASTAVAVSSGGSSLELDHPSSVLPHAPETLTEVTELVPGTATTGMAPSSTATPSTSPVSHVTEPATYSTDVTNPSTTTSTLSEAPEVVSVGFSWVTEPVTTHSSISSTPTPKIASSSPAEPSDRYPVSSSSASVSSKSQVEDVRLSEHTPMDSSLTAFPTFSKDIASALTTETVLQTTITGASSSIPETFTMETTGKSGIIKSSVESPYEAPFASMTPEILATKETIPVTTLANRVTEFSQESDIVAVTKSSDDLAEVLGTTLPETGNETTEARKLTSTLPVILETQPMPSGIPSDSLLHLPGDDTSFTTSAAPQEGLKFATETRGLPDASTASTRTLFSLDLSDMKTDQTTARKPIRFFVTKPGNLSLEENMPVSSTSGHIFKSPASSTTVHTTEEVSYSSSPVNLSKPKTEAPEVEIGQYGNSTTTKTFSETLTGLASTTEAEESTSTQGIIATELPKNVLITLPATSMVGEALDVSGHTDAEISPQSPPTARTNTGELQESAVATTPTVSDVHSAEPSVTEEVENNVQMTSSHSTTTAGTATAKLPDTTIGEFSTITITTGTWDIDPHKGGNESETSFHSPEVSGITAAEFLHSTLVTVPVTSVNLFGESSAIVGMETTGQATSSELPGSAGIAVSKLPHTTVGTILTTTNVDRTPDIDAREIVEGLKISIPSTEMLGTTAAELLENFPVSLSAASGFSETLAADQTAFSQSVGSARTSSLPDTTAGITTSTIVEETSDNDSQKTTGDLKTSSHLPGATETATKLPNSTLVTLPATSVSSETLTADILETTGPAASSQTPRSAETATSRLPDTTGDRSPSGTLVDEVSGIDARESTSPSTFSMSREPVETTVSNIAEKAEVFIGATSSFRPNGTLALSTDKQTDTTSLSLEAIAFSDAGASNTTIVFISAASVQYVDETISFEADESTKLGSYTQSGGTAGTVTEIPAQATVTISTTSAGDLNEPSAIDTLRTTRSRTFPQSPESVGTPTAESSVMAEVATPATFVSGLDKTPAWNTQETDGEFKLPSPSSGVVVTTARELKDSTVIAFSTTSAEGSDKTLYFNADETATLRTSSELPEAGGIAGATAVKSVDTTPATSTTRSKESSTDSTETAMLRTSSELPEAVGTAAATLVKAVATIPDTSTTHSNESSTVDSTETAEMKTSSQKAESVETTTVERPRHAEITVPTKSEFESKETLAISTYGSAGPFRNSSFSLEAAVTIAAEEPNTTVVTITASPTEDSDETYFKVDEDTELKTSSRSSIATETVTAVPVKTIVTIPPTSVLHTGEFLVTDILETVGLSTSSKSAESVETSAAEALQSTKVPVSSVSNINRTLSFTTHKTAGKLETVYPGATTATATKLPDTTVIILGDSQDSDETSFFKGEETEPRMSSQSQGTTGTTAAGLPADEVTTLATSVIPSEETAVFHTHENAELRTVSQSQESMDTTTAGTPAKTIVTTPSALTGDSSENLSTKPDEITELDLSSHSPAARPSTTFRLPDLTGGTVSLTTVIAETLAFDSQESAGALETSPRSPVTIKTTSPKLQSNTEVTSPATSARDSGVTFASDALETAALSTSSQLPRQMETIAAAEALNIGKTAPSSEIGSNKSVTNDTREYAELQSSSQSASFIVATTAEVPADTVITGFATSVVDYEETSAIDTNGTAGLTSTPRSPDTVFSTAGGLPGRTTSPAVDSDERVSAKTDESAGFKTSRSPVTIERLPDTTSATATSTYNSGETFAVDVNETALLASTSESPGTARITLTVLPDTTATAMPDTVIDDKTPTIVTYVTDSLRTLHQSPASIKSNATGFSNYTLVTLPTTSIAYETLAMEAHSTIGPVPSSLSPESVKTAVAELQDIKEVTSTIDPDVTPAIATSETSKFGTSPQLVGSTRSTAAELFVITESAILPTHAGEFDETLAIDIHEISESSTAPRSPQAITAAVTAASELGNVTVVTNAGSSPVDSDLGARVRTSSQSPASVVPTRNPTLVTVQLRDPLTNQLITIQGFDPVIIAEDGRCECTCPANSVAAAVELTGSGPNL